MVKVSVVVPVYNVENYIRDCLDSIVNQTLKDIEIICINDGSPDNSLEILKEYAAKDSRMTVLDQENGGHAVATNRGIELATGECLFLMDSDDVLELNALELSYNRLKEKDVDFVMFKAINYVDAEDRYYETEVYSMGEIYKKVGDDVFNYQDIGELMFQASVTPWSKLYKRDFINKENIRFPEGLIFEDNVFFYKALLTAKRICFLDEFLFIRRWYSTSSTTNGDLRFLNSLDVTNLMIDVFKENNEFDNYKHRLLNLKINLNFMRYNKVKKEFKEEFFQGLKKDFIKLLNNKSIYDDFIKVANYRNKKIFEQVIISENSIEFDKFREYYDKQMSNYGLVKFNKKSLLNKLISYNRTLVNQLKNENEVNFYMSLKEDANKIFNNDYLYNELIKHADPDNYNFYKNLMDSNTVGEFFNLTNLYNEQIQKFNQFNLSNGSIDFNKFINYKIETLENLNENYKEDFFKEMKFDFNYILSDKVYLYNIFKNSVSYGNRKLFEQVIISENYSEFSKLRKIYDMQMTNPKLFRNIRNKFNVNNIIWDNVNDLSRLDDLNKEYYFEFIKLDFIKVLNDSFLYEYFIENANYGSRKLFEQIIISENIDEFFKLRECYDHQMDSYSLFNRINDKSLFNNLIEDFIMKLFTLKARYREKYFNDFSNDLNGTIGDKMFYDYFFNSLNYHNKKIFEHILISCNVDEFLLLRKLYHIKLNRSEQNYLRRLKEQYHYLIKFKNLSIER